MAVNAPVVSNMGAVDLVRHNLQQEVVMKYPSYTQRIVTATTEALIEYSRFADDWPTYQRVGNAADAFGNILLALEEDYEDECTIF